MVECFVAFPEPFLPGPSHPHRSLHNLHIHHHPPDCSSLLPSIVVVDVDVDVDDDGGEHVVEIGDDILRGGGNAEGALGEPGAVHSPHILGVVGGVIRDGLGGVDGENGADGNGDVRVVRNYDCDGEHDDLVEHPLLVFPFSVLRVSLVFQQELFVHH